MGLRRTNLEVVVLSWGWVTHTLSIVGWVLAKAQIIFSKLVVVWSLLYWAKRLLIQDCRIFGDSRVAIDWLKGNTELAAPHLQHWCRCTKDMFYSFAHLNFEHIYRCFNKEADILSKRVLGSPLGYLYYAEYVDAKVVDKGSIIVFWAFISALILSLA